MSILKVSSVRLLMFHVDYFRSKVTERGRSKVVEKVGEMEKGLSVDEALVSSSASRRWMRPIWRGASRRRVGRSPALASGWGWGPW